METFNTLKPLALAKARYATKKYNNKKQIPEEKIEVLKKVLHLSPSSINIQPWKFTFVRNLEVKSQLAAASLHNENKINQANLLIVFSVVDNLDVFQHVVDTEIPEALRDWYNSLKETIPESEIKTWMSKQVYIALGIALSTVAALGLDSTPMEGVEPKKYKAILNMSNYKPIIALAVGYGANDDYNRPEVMSKSRREFNNVIEDV